MALFKRDFNKPGPGVPKNAPRKKGFGRFFELLGRDFGNLVKLNLLYALTILPSQILFVMAWIGMGVGNKTMLVGCGLLGIIALAPVGASTTAMYRLISKMLQDDPGFVWHDFKRYFKENFIPMLLPGVIYGLIILSQIFAFLYYTNLKGNIGFVMVAIYLFSVLLLGMSAPYYFTQAAYLHLGPLALLKNSLLMAMGFAVPNSLLGTLLGGGLVLVQYLFFPIAIPIQLTIGFTIPCLLNLMWIWPKIDKTFEIEKTLRERQKKELQDVFGVQEDS